MLFSHTHPSITTWPATATHADLGNYVRFGSIQSKAEQFNCAQRAHANFLENAPQTMLFTLVAGLKYPNLAAGLGGAWVVCRSLFLYGYVYSGKPQGKGRYMGGFFWLVQGALWGVTVFGVAKELIAF